MSDKGASLAEVEARLNEICDGPGAWANHGKTCGCRCCEARRTIRAVRPLLKQLQRWDRTDEDHDIGATARTTLDALLAPTPTKEE